MMIHSLFDGERVRLAPRDPERDAEIEAQWTHDPDYARLTDAGIAQPRSSHDIRKMYEEDEKERAHFTFALRTIDGDRLVGWAALRWVDLVHGTALMSLAIGSPGDRGLGYGTDALKLILRYAFAELNLFRVSAVTFEYNSRAVHFLERAGFRTEVCRREALFRDGMRWNLLGLGLLREEWEAGR